jgi:hypothetical protein
MVSKRKVFLLINPNEINESEIIERVKLYKSRHSYFVFCGIPKKINNFWVNFIKMNKNNVILIDKYDKKFIKNKTLNSIYRYFLFTNLDDKITIPNKKIIPLSYKKIIGTESHDFKNISLEKLIFLYVEQYFYNNFPIILLGNDAKKWSFINLTKAESTKSDQIKKYIIEI